MYNYEDIKGTLETQEINCSGDYIQKALREFGYKRFPKSGLNEEGKNKLIETIIDIHNNDASLKLKQSKSKQIKQISTKKNLVKKIKKNDLIYWDKHVHNYLDNIIYETYFPLLDQKISVSSFSPTDVLNIGDSVLKGGIGNDTGLKFGYQTFGGRYFAYPNIKADTRLFLQCIFYDDYTDWSAIDAFFKGSKLIGIWSRERNRYGPFDKNLIKYIEDGNLLEIYKYELDRVAKEVLSYKKGKDVFQEMVKIIKSRSPSRKCLPKSHKEGIAEILK